MTEIYRLSIVRLAQAEHAELAYLNATLSSNNSLVVCGAVAPLLGSAANVTGAACVPGTPMWLNVSHDVDWVSCLAVLPHCRSTLFMRSSRWMGEVMYGL